MALVELEKGRSHIHILIVFSQKGFKRNVENGSNFIFLGNWKCQTVPSNSSSLVGLAENIATLISLTKQNNLPMTQYSAYLCMEMPGRRILPSDAKTT